MLPIFSPYDRTLIKEIPMSSGEEAEKLLQQAYNLFSDNSKWLPAAKRIEILEKTARIMQERVEELTEIAVREGGKPYIDSRAEVERAINGVRIAMNEITKIAGEQIPMGLNKASENRLAFTIKEPGGVVFSISAFNHPLNLIIHQTVTAIAAGCPVIVKPALTTPLSCINFIEIVKQAGLPDGWAEYLICPDEISESIACDARVHYLSFIGSAKVGWYLRSKIAAGTRCALEHGGAAPVIVEEDADLDELIPSLLKGGFYHAGQVCVSIQRIFIHEKICGEVSSLLSEAAKKLIVGDPLHKDTQVGPLILPKEVDRVHEWIKEAIDKGAKLLCGGKKISDTCYAPTVLLNPPTDIRISTREVFGPVVSIYSFSKRSEAVRQANALNLHFQAAVFTKNIDNAMYCIRNLDAASVMINDHTAFRVDWMPFGGRDHSGLGTGGIRYTMNEMLREKLIVIKSTVL